MGLTDDRNDPRLRVVGAVGMQEAYLVLSAAERAKGFIRPVRSSYVHLRCGTVTRMGDAIAETYAREPSFYGGTYCARCRTHFPVGRLAPEFGGEEGGTGEFTWDRMDRMEPGAAVGT